jgi:succinate dehydrogenase / fumarate reductase, iron-sulfur subunit
MGQIMRLRRIAVDDQHIVDRNNGERHEAAFTTLVRDYGLNHEAELLSRSYGGNSWFGKFRPAAGKELLSSLQIIALGMLRRKMNPKLAIFGHKIPSADLKAVKTIYRKVDDQPERYELNLYVTGRDEDDEPAPSSQAPSGSDRAAAGAANEADAPQNSATPPQAAAASATETAGTAAANEGEQA